MSEETADRILDAVTDVLAHSNVSVTDGLTLLARIQSIIYSEVTKDEGE